MMNENETPITPVATPETMPPAAPEVMPEAAPEEMPKVVPAPEMPAAEPAQ